MYIFKNKLDPERSKICENCGSKNTIAYKRKKINDIYLVKMVCLDCECFSGALPHQLFDMDKLPEKTYDQEFKWKTRKFVEDYKNYITSTEWKDKTEVWKKKANYTCQQCGKKNVVLQCHHKNYDNFKNEKDEDILVLCLDCHSEKHNRSFMNNF